MTERTHPLIGKTIIGMKIADDQQALLFVLDNDETLIARTDGDCCSHSWIEHVELPTEFPAKVLSCDDLDMNKEDVSNEEHECLTFYGYKIVTDKGDIVIDYRNSSNGYYGGSISFDGDDYYYGGVHGQNVSSMNWKDITQ